MGGPLTDFLAQTGVWVGGLGLAAFLALFWVLRGAPPGQAVPDEDDADVGAPRGGYRDRVVAAVTLGMVLILIGAYLAVSRGIAWAAPAFALGFGTVVTLVLINARHRHGSPTLRRTLDLATAALNAALVAGVLIVLNVVVFRYGGRPFDLTREGSYSLSSLTLNQLRTLDRPVTLTSFFGRSSVAVQQYDRVRELLDMYKAANPAKVRLDHVDPFRDQARYEALAKRVPNVDVTQGGGVVVEYGEEGSSGERAAVVRNADLFERPRAGRFDPDVDRRETAFRGEDAVTSALMRLRGGSRQIVAFTTGHGEPSVEDLDPNRPGLGAWASRLSATGSQVRTVNLLTEGVPDDASLVVVAGPRTPLKADEVARLRTAFDRKVPLLLLLGDAEASGLDDLLAAVNLGLGKGFTVEPRLNYPRNREVLLVPVGGSPTHPILQPLANQMLLFPRPAPLRLSAPTNPTGPASNFVGTPLLKTSGESWVEPELATRRAEKNQGDEAGPVVVGVAVTDRPAPSDTKAPAPRLVVFSSPHLGGNPLLQLDPTNLDLLMNAASWLRGRPDSGGISPQVHVSMTLTPDPVLRSRLVLVPTVMAVLLIVTLGVTTYLARRY